MEQVILKDENDWKQWELFSEQKWNLKHTDERVPNEYPCILVCHIDHKLDMIYDFVYKSSFDIK